MLGLLLNTSVGQKEHASRTLEQGEGASLFRKKEPRELTVRPLQDEKDRNH